MSASSASGFSLARVIASTARDRAVAVLVVVAFGTALLFNAALSFAAVLVYRQGVEMTSKAADHEALVGPGFVDSFTVACATSATEIRANGQMSYTCQNPSTTLVAVGDSGITDPTDAKNSPVYCATNCPAEEWGGNVRSEYCRADTGTVTIYCRAMVAASAAP